jgi:hypothetical protein
MQIHIHIAITCGKYPRKTSEKTSVGLKVLAQFVAELLLSAHRKGLKSDIIDIRLIGIRII